MYAVSVDVLVQGAVGFDEELGPVIARRARMACVSELRFPTMNSIASCADVSPSFLLPPKEILPRDNQKEEKKKKPGKRRKPQKTHIPLPQPHEQIPPRPLGYITQHPPPARLPVVLGAMVRPERILDHIRAGARGYEFGGVGQAADDGDAGEAGGRRGGEGSGGLGFAREGEGAMEGGGGAEGG